MNNNQSTSKRLKNYLTCRFIYYIYDKTRQLDTSVLTVSNWQNWRFQSGCANIVKSNILLSRHLDLSNRTCLSVNCITAGLTQHACLLKIVVIVDELPCCQFG